jgi:hypothetical protein
MLPDRGSALRHPVLTVSTDMEKPIPDPKKRAAGFS